MMGLMQRYIILFFLFVMTSLLLLATSNWFQTRPPKPLPDYNPSEIVQEINTPKTQNIKIEIVEKQVEFTQEFKNIGLETNTSIAKIPLSEVLGGGPAKDGIPAIDAPVWESVNRAAEVLKNESLGVLVKSGNVSRYYPYDILYWHEIVNDRIGNENISVTFCPLCGSVVVFKREEDSFGVSGKLWQSNLLMYDRETETLWSQITGEAVVGDRTGEELERFPSSVLTFEQVQASFPDAQVLSRQTGHRRAYGRNPYGTYETNDDIFFPVEQTDSSFPPKELFVLVNVDDSTLGFHRGDLLKAKKAEVFVNDKKITARVNLDNTIKITDESGGEYPSYIAMWFSWVTHNDRPKEIWSLSQE